MINILIVDNHDSFVYNLVDIIRRAKDVNYEIVKVEYINTINTETYQKILLSPGPGIPEERPEMIALIRRCYTTHSILGVCLGHQAIAVAFGSKLVKMNNPRHGHISKLTLATHIDKLFKDIDGDINVGRYHSWIISDHDMPTGFHVTSRDEENNIMSITHNKYPIYGVQFHPESIMTPQGDKIIRNWIYE